MPNMTIGKYCAQAKARTVAIACDRRRWRAAIRSVAVLLVSLALTPFFAPDAARADESRYWQFYTPPEPLPAGALGDLIRTEPSRLALEPSGQLGSYVGTGTRIMYRSTDNNGKPVAATGTYIEPDNPWPGDGPRPLLVYAPLPNGMGEQCAASRLINQGIHASGDTGFDLMVNLDSMFLTTLLARGYSIVIPDGIGSGVHGRMAPQLLMRIASATAVIDAARAAKKLPGTSLTPDGPVAFWGWFSGGSAALAAAELASTYGPELKIAGTVAMEPVTDMASVASSADGSFLVGAMGWLLNAIVATYPEFDQPLREMLTPRGLEMFENTAGQCMLQTGTDYAFRHVQPWFKNDILQAVRQEPFKSLSDAQRIGNHKPTGPVYIEHNRWDPVGPYTDAMATAKDWCAMGADVTFWTNELPPLFNKLGTNLFLAPLVDGERNMAWLADRFNGVPTSSNCSELP